MYPKGLFKPCREATEEFLSEQLPRHGFETEPRHFGDGAFRRWWLRPGDWRVDVVELVFRRGGERRMLINLFVLLPALQLIEPGNFVAGHGILTPSLPYWFPRLRIRRYARRVWAAVEKELAWFDGCSTPARCLFVVQGQYDRPAPPGSERQRVEEHLTQLAEESPNPSLQRTIPGRSPGYCR